MATSNCHPAPLVCRIGFQDGAAAKRGVMTAEARLAAVTVPPHLGADRISLRGIAAQGHHGVFGFEREQGQRFVVDVVCNVDLRQAAATDDLQATVDYGALAQAVVADIEGSPLNLIEALADRIARDRKSTRLNSSHANISYAVFCLKKKKH